MSRRLLRLISCVCMVAYALTNTHVNLAWSQYVQLRPVVQEASSTDESERSGCKHCAKRGKATKPATGQQQCPKPSSEHPACPDSPGCPGCPCGDHSCPIPGGCSMCSVAKAPCLTDSPTVNTGEPLAGEVAIEYARVHVSPFHASLIRPPRA